MKATLSTAEAAICRTIATNLRHFRELRGWTQLQLAEHAGVSRATVNRHERMVQRPHADSLLLMARCLAVGLDEMCTPLPSRKLASKP